MFACLFLTCLPLSFSLSGHVHSSPPFILHCFARQCAYKLLYSQPSWSYSGLPDGLPLAPVGRLILEGYRLIIGMPITSASAVVRAQMHPCTMANLRHAMMNMGHDHFLQAGGWWIMAKAGDVVLIPGMSLIAEFNLVERDDDDEGNPMDPPSPPVITQTMSWVAMMKYNLSEDFLMSALECADFLLKNACCAAESSQLQADLQA